MGEYLDDTIADLIPVREHEAAALTEPFGLGFAGAYGYPGITYYEPDIGEARRAMRRVYTDYPSAKSRARAGRQRVLTDISWETAIGDIEQACESLMTVLSTTS
jgi:hypothetical protein